MDKDIVVEMHTIAENVELRKQLDIAIKAMKEAMQEAHMKHGRRGYWVILNEALEKIEKEGKNG